jgi:hypothetical protein
LRSGLLIAVCLLLLGLADYAGSLAGFNTYFYDLAFRIRGQRSPDNSIIIAAIDEKTLAELGRWPIPRLHYARLLEELAGAEAVGIDLILAEASEDDALLGEAIRKHGRVVLPVYFETAHQVSVPVQEFAAAAVGHIHLEQEIDGAASWPHWSPAVQRWPARRAIPSPRPTGWCRAFPGTSIIMEEAGLFRTCRWSISSMVTMTRIFLPAKRCSSGQSLRDWKMTC